MRTIGILTLLILLVTATSAFAVKPDEMLKDLALEARARALSAELRCVVCEGQSIDDSDADIARDIRILVRRRLQAGDDEAAIRKYLVARYGPYILLRPPMTPETVLLWITPALALVLGIAGIIVAVRRSARLRPPPTALDASEAARLDALMAKEEQAST